LKKNKTQYPKVCKQKHYQYKNHGVPNTIPLQYLKHSSHLLVASYDMHGLQWDYSYSLVTTRGC